MFEKHIQKKLETYVRRYFTAHPEVKLVAVAGSLGKTSTKVAIATVLSQQYRVRLHEGDRGTSLSVPLAVLGIEHPLRGGLFAWMGVLRAARRRIHAPADVDVIVQELGANYPGAMAHYSTYLLPDISVITAVTSERMDVFSTIESVAKEELAVAQFSRLAIINRDDIDGRYASYLTNGNLTTYGTSGAAEYRFITEDFNPEGGHTGLLIAPDSEQPLAVTVQVSGEHSLRPAIAAATVGYKLGMNAAMIVKGLGQIRPLPGRMNILRGVKQTILIDDTYNSSPLSSASALQTLYTFQAPQRIAVFTSMSDLGLDSQKEHEMLGKLCDPNMLSWVIVVGDEAARYLAPIAKSQGCQVMVCANALDAGAFAHKVLEEGAVILFNGSRDDVYCEEAIKVVLHSTDDEARLVRQSVSQLAEKSQFFSKFV